MEVADASALVARVQRPLPRPVEPGTLAVTPRRRLCSKRVLDDALDVGEPGPHVDQGHDEEPRARPVLGRAWSAIR